MTILAKAAGSDVSVIATGAFDHERHRYSLSLAASGLSVSSGPRNVIATDETVYLDFPLLAQRLGAPTAWISVRDADPRALGLPLVDPLRVLDAAAQNDAEVDVGADGLVRRITMRFDAPGNAAGSEGSVVVSVEYSDVGAPVTIEPPPAAQVTDETDAVNRLFGGTTGR
jgi:hypothetical protein